MTTKCVGTINVRPGLSIEQIRKISSKGFFIFTQSNSNKIFDQISIIPPSFFLKDEFITDEFEKLFIFLGDQISLEGILHIFQDGKKNRIIEVTERITKKEGKRINQKSIQIFGCKPNHPKKAKNSTSFNEKLKQANEPIKIEKMNPEQQVELLISTMKKKGNIIPLMEGLESCYKTPKNFKKTMGIYIFGIEKLKNLVLETLETINEGPTIPSLLNLIKFICYTGGNKIPIKKKGGIDIIFRLMKLYPDWPDIQACSCAVLTSFASLYHDNILTRKEGGFELILEAMKLYPHNEDIQRSGCKILSKLALYSDCRPSIIEKGGVELIFRSMKIHPYHIDGQKHAFKALWYLEPIEHPIWIKTEERIDIIFQLMKSNFSHIETQYRACVLLKTSMFNTNIWELIYKKGGFEIILQSMKMHIKCNKFQKTVCELLWYTMRTTNTKIRILIGEKGGIDLILQAMKLHSADIAFQHSALFLLWDISSPHENKRLIANKGGIELIFQKMKQYPDDDLVSCCAEGILKSLAENRANKKLINSLGFEV